MFWNRLLSGVVLLAIAVLSLWAGAPLLTIFLAVVSLIGYLELTRALGIEQNEQKEKKCIGPMEVVGAVAVIVYYGLLLLCNMGYLRCGGQELMLPCTVILFLGELFIYVFTFPKYRVESVMAAVFSFLYVPLMISFIELTRMEKGGIYAVWVILICSWGSDTCAYAVGKLIGKKKVFPSLSPKKSLEGCIGGALGAALLGALYSRWVVAQKNTVLFALACALGAVVSMVGDLAASAIKRNRGIKDYGKLIPGHGGVMDRFDSVIVTAPIVYFLTRALWMF